MSRLIKYATFRPQDDITRDEVIQIANGYLHTIAERDGFTISIDDNVSLDDALYFVEKLSAFIWPSGQVIHGEGTYTKETMRHYKVVSTFDVRTGVETRVR